MFSLCRSTCAGPARELSSRYVYGNGRNIAWETRNGISRTWSVGEDKLNLKTFRRQKHHPLTVAGARTQTWCTWSWLPQSRPTPVKRHDRFMIMLGICLANASSPDVHWEVWWGTTAADTLWCQSWSLTTMKFPVLLCKSIEGVQDCNCLTFCASSILLPNTRFF